jgi:hypothetical protein
MKITRILAAFLILLPLAFATGSALAAAGDIVHTVRTGDNLLLLTKMYGVSGYRIRAANPTWTDPNVMHAGDWSSR